MRKIHLHGNLSQFGSVIELDVITAGEAVRALGIVCPGFFEVLQNGYYHVVAGNFDDGLFLDEEDIPSLRLGSGDLHIMPAIAGAKNGGALKAIAGVVLIGAAVFLSGGVLGAFVIGGSGITWGNVAMIGAAMAVTGASQLLAPADKGDESKTSFTSSGPGNTTEQGGPVPLVYGEVITGGIIISAGMDIEKVDD